MRALISLFIITILFSSCEKVVDVDLSNNEEKLVVEGSITNQPGPYYVRLTKSVNFNDPSSYPPVSGAIVVIADNTGQRDTLTYSTNGMYRTQLIQGIEGRTYFLTIVSGNNTYSAQTTMPIRVGFDSIKLNIFQFNGEDEINVIPRYTDPVELGNNYRFIQSINNKVDETYFAYNDNLNNGEPNQRPLRSDDPDLELKTGDIVQIEMQCIPLNTYNYYYSLGEQSGGGFGGGSAPANPTNNITGGALGLFSAHTSEINTIVIP